MTIQQCYQEINGDYEGVYRRIPSEALIRKFALKFPEDKSMEQLTEVLRGGDAEGAFGAAHTLKGLCLTLGFSAMTAPACELTELLRGRILNGYEATYAHLLQEYEKTIDLLKRVD